MKTAKQEKIGNESYRYFSMPAIESISDAQAAFEALMAHNVVSFGGLRRLQKDDSAEGRKSATIYAKTRDDDIKEGAINILHRAWALMDEEFHGMGEAEKEGKTKSIKEGLINEALSFFGFEEGDIMATQEKIIDSLLKRLVKEDKP